MISSHKSSSYNSKDNHLVASINKDDSIDSAAENTQPSNLIVIPNNDESPQPSTLAPISSIATASETNNITVTGCTMEPSSLFSSTIIDPYIAKNPNLTYKTNADDIMSMDIIFDNVPIEEDPTIGNNVTIIHETSPPTVATDNVHYEIIELNESNQSGAGIRHQLPDTNYSQLDDSSNDGVLVIDETVQSPIEYNEIVIDSNDVVMMSSPALPPASPQNDFAIAASSKDTNVDENACPETAALSPPEVESNFLQPTPDEPEAVEMKQARIRRSKTIPLKSEPAVKSEDAPEKLSDAKDSVASISKRKRKPLPALIGRSKKSTKGKSQPPVNTDTVAENEMKPSIECEKIADTVIAEPSTSTRYHEQETHSVHEDEDADDTDEKNDSNDSDANNFMNSLVVVESQDPNDPQKTIHEVYVVCPETKKMSDQPLDLPDAVIQRIRLSMMPEAE